MLSYPRKSPYRLQALLQLVWMEAGSRMELPNLGLPSGEGRPTKKTNKQTNKKTPTKHTKKLSLRYKVDLLVWKEAPTPVYLHSPGECNCGSQRVSLICFTAISVS